MNVSESLSKAFGQEFEKWIGDFVARKGLLPDATSLQSQRVINRSIVPHVMRLSSLFNRENQEQDEGLAPYWKESSHPQNLRLAYFLYFMPANLFRMASVWTELHRLGFQWRLPSLQAIEFGAGPASGACGIAAGETYASIGLPKTGSWALIEQDRAILELGAEWAQTYFSHLSCSDWAIRPFHRKIDLSRGFLPSQAPKFNLWLMSFYLNELQLPADELADHLLKSWHRHLEEEGVVILIEPALKLQSRRLLQLREALIKKMPSDLKVLLPCLGHQACGALRNPEDWCHEEVSWWRPPYCRTIDKLAGLDRKTLPFSYLVLVKSSRSHEEILPALAIGKRSDRYRLVSPAHREGQDQEFFLCGQDGKKRARFRSQDPLQRGDILLGAQVRGNANSSRVEAIQSLARGAGSRIEGEKGHVVSDQEPNRQ